MSKILHSVPCPYLIVVSGEAVGMDEMETQRMILNSVSFTAQMAASNRQLNVFVGADAVRLQGQATPKGT